MADDLHRAFAQLRDAVLDDEHLVRALASGRRRGQPQPRWRRVELRYVDLKAGRHLQLTAYDDTQAHVTNRQDAAAAVDELLAEPFANWHVETTTHTHQLRVTKKGEPLLHTSERAEPVTPQRTHDHTKQRLLPEDHRVLRALGISDAQGRVKPSRQAKYRQVEEFLRALAVAIEDATRTGKLREPTPQDPLRVVDLGCGNAYLTFAAHAWLSEQMPVRLVGVDVKEQSRRHNTEVAEELGLAERAVVRRRRHQGRHPPGTAGHRARPARLRHRHRRRPLPGSRLGCRPGPRGALLSPRHLRSAAPGPRTGRVRRDDARRDPP